MTPNFERYAVMTTDTQHKSNAINDSSRQPSSGQSGSTLQPTQDIVDYVREYARQKPDVAALWCFGLGIVVGWKIKPW